MNRRGAIFVITMWVIIVLGAMVLIFARSMRTELIASGNIAQEDQASAIELGAEQYVLSEVDDTDGEADYILQQEGEALQVGNGYFWLLRPAADEQTYEFGITDEASKLNLNTAGEQSMMMLPGMTQVAADSIIDWRDADENVTGEGAESTYYQSLPEPYRSKNSPLETVEESLLVNGVTTDLLFGVDRNRNAVVDPAEAAQGGMQPNFMGTVSNRGIFPFVTVYSMEPNVDSTGTARVNVNTNGATVVVSNQGANKSVSATPTPTPPGRPGAPADNPALRNALQAAGLQSNRVNQIVTAASSRQPFANIFDFAQKTGMTSQELRLAADRLTTRNEKTQQGLINVNTAPREVLMTLPGIQQADADALIAGRSSSDTTSIAWVADALGMEKAARIGGAITNRSFIYSADIVAVSGDGRAFRRVRIVVDARQTPAKIIYRKDLTALGWPLPPQVRDNLRQGQPPPVVGQSSGTSKMGSR